MKSEPLERVAAVLTISHKLTQQSGKLLKQRQPAGWGNSAANLVRECLIDREADAPPIKTGTRISRIGAVARALDEQQPVFIADVAQEMQKHPALAPFAAESVGRPTYAFPVSTSQKQYGILIVFAKGG